MAVHCERHGTLVELVRKTCQKVARLGDHTNKKGDERILQLHHGPRRRAEQSMRRRSDACAV